MSSTPPDYRTFELPYQNNAGFEAEMAYAPRKRLGCCFCGCCSGCLLLILLFIAALAAIWYFCLTGGAPLTVSPETTIITEPLKSDGKTVDFHKAIQKMIEPDIKADENGFRDVVIGYGQAVFEPGHNKNDAQQQYLLMCEGLGIDPQTPPTFSLPSPGADVNQWLAEAENGLDAVQVAAAKPHYFVPMTRKDERDLVVRSLPVATYAFHEKLSQALRTRANVRYAEKKIDEGWKDTLTSLRLFRFVTINRTWQHVIQNGVYDNNAESLLTPVAEIVATLPQWTPEQLTQGIKDLESLPGWQDRQTTLQVLQFALLDLILTANDVTEFVRRCDDGEVPPPGFAKAIQRGFDLNLLAKEMNEAVKGHGELMEQVAGKSLDEQFDLLRLRETEEHPKLFDEGKLQALLEDKIIGDISLNPLFTPGRSRLIGIVAGEAVTATAGEMYRLQIMEESRCQALRLALALERYHREKLEYPDSLNALGLKPMPMNMSLQYEKKGDGYRIENKVFLLEIQ